MLFGAIFLLVLIILSGMMTVEKWFDQKLIQNRNARTVQMMEQPENTIDVFNMGDSLSLAGFTPMELYRQKGFTAFNIGADGIRMPEAYYAVIEDCAKQNPKYLLLESLILFRYSFNQDAQMVISQPLYHRFAFLKYHSIWKPFVEGPGVMIYHRGYTVNQNVGGYYGPIDYLDQKLEGNSRSDREDFIGVVEILKQNPQLFEYLEKLITDVCEINSLNDLKESFDKDYVSKFGKTILKWNI